MLNPIESRIIVMMFVFGLYLCCCPLITSATCRTDSLPDLGKPVRQLDSIPAKVLDPLLQKVKEIPAGLKERAAGLLPGSSVNDVKEALSLKKILNSHKISIVNEGQIERTYWGTGYHFLNTLRVNGSMQVAKIPLTVMFMHQDYLNPSFAYRNAFQAQFDKDAFLDNYKKKLKDKLDVDKLIPKNNVLQAAKEAADKAVRKELDGMLQEYKTEFSEPLAAFDTIRNLSTGNIGGVFQSLVNSQYVAGIKEKEQELQQLSSEVQSGKVGEKVKSIPSLKKEIAIYTKLLSFYQRYQALKKKLDLVGIENRLNEEGLQRMANLENMLDNPASLQQLAGQHLQLSGMEKLFMNVQQMNMGQHSVTLSPLTLYNYLNNGVSIEISKDKKYFFALAGKERDFNSLYDRANFSALQQNDHIGMGVRMGRGSLKENHTHFSLFSFRQSKMQAAADRFDMPKKNTVVLGLSNRLNIGESSSLELELSKSSAVYAQAEYGADTMGRRKSALAGLFSGEDFAQSMAVAMNYTGSFEEAGLNVGANFTHVASAYNNPGSAFMLGGSKDAGLQLRKSFFKNKFVLQARGNMREYSYTMLPGRKWQNFSYMFESRFRLPNGQQLSLKYQPVKSVRKEDGKRFTINNTEKFTAEVSLQKRLGQSFYRNVISTTYNASRYLYRTDSMAKLKSLTVSSLQNVSIGRQLVYWNVTYTHARNPGGPAYLNSVLNTDVGITYALGKYISSTTALNYSSAQNWYRQVGARQTITATLNSRMQLSLFVDYRQNIQQYYFYYDDLTRADWSFRYNF
jgi:hypothetical protein